MLPLLKSINRVHVRYSTGEQPLLVECDDMNNYICKYRRSTASGYKLVSELSGSIFASHWGINTPPIAVVELQSEHRGMLTDSRYPYRACFGSRMNQDAVDLTKLSVERVKKSRQNIQEIIRLALFDLWLANEDRNSNNANLLYDVDQHQIIAIDHGCLFNTSDYGVTPSLLTENESIINSEIASHLLRNLEDVSFVEFSLMTLHEEIDNMLEYISRCQNEIQNLLSAIPSEWEIDKGDIEYSLNRVCNPEWIAKCKNVGFEYIEERLRMENRNI